MFEDNISAGNTLFELDFLLTSDNEVICTHQFEHTPYSKNNRPTLEEFENLTLKGKYHGITFNWLIDTLKSNPEVKIVFDTKEDDTFKIINRMVDSSIEQGFNFYNQFIIQIYSYEDYNEIKENFPEIQEFWFTNYKAHYSFKKMFNLFEDKEDVTTYVLYYSNWWQYSFCGQKTDKHFAVHTINKHSYINFLISKGVDYIFTDWGKNVVI